MPGLLEPSWPGGENPVVPRSGDNKKDNDREKDRNSFPQILVSCIDDRIPLLSPTIALQTSETGHRFDVMYVTTPGVRCVQKGLMSVKGP